MFITLEGIDGSGKTTLLQNLCYKLSEYFEYKLDIFIKKKSFDGINPDPLSMESMLYYLSHNVISSCALKEMSDSHDLLFCDRYMDSIFAYQVCAARLDIDLYATYVKKLLPPNLTIWLDCSVEVAQSRILSERTLDTMERMPKEFHEHVRNGYRLLRHLNEYRIHRIDCERFNEEEVADQAMNIILDKLTVLGTPYISKWIQGKKQYEEKIKNQ